MKAIFITIALIIIQLFIFQTAFAQEELNIKLESVNKEYVIREPVKFVITLENVSEKELRIVNIGAFDMDMVFFRLEVTYPNGEVKRRRYNMGHALRHLQSEWRGEPLYPGESTVTFLYPNVSRDVAQIGSKLEVTFPFPGEYRLRVIYVMPTTFKKMWKGPDGEAYSNEIVLKFREPDEIEKEILDAYWAMGGYYISMGDDSKFCHYDISALERVIEKYPDHPFTKYPYFGLAIEMCNITRHGNKQFVQRSINILLKLMQYYPEFRADEVQMHIASSHNRLHNYNKARELYKSILTERPWLQDNIYFVKLMKIAEVAGTGKPVGDWIHDRIKRQRTEIKLNKQWEK